MMNSTKLIFLFSLILVIISSCTRVIKKPVAPKIPYTEIHFGEQISDDYHWMKDKTRKDPKVMSYIKQENEYTDFMMKHTQDLRDTLFNESISRIDENDLSVPKKRGDYYYYSRKEKGKQYSIYCRKKGNLDSQEEITLNVNEVAKGKKFFSLGELEYSPDDQYLAYSADTTGAEFYDIFIKNLNTGKILADRIHNIDGITWANDNQTIFYSVTDESGRTYQVYRHHLGETTVKDDLVFEEKDNKFYTWTYRSRSNRFIFLATGSKTTSEVFFLDANHPDGKFQLIEKRKQGVEYYPQHSGKYFYILTNSDGAENFKIVRTPINKPQKKNWKTYIPPLENVRIGFSIFKNFIVLYGRINAVRSFKCIDLKTGKDFSPKFDEDYFTVYGTGNLEYDPDVYRFAYESYQTPESIYELNFKTQKMNLLKQRKIKNYNPKDFETKLIYAPSSDGVNIPISMIYKKSKVKYGSPSKMLLSAYGSYGDSSDPYFSNSRISLLDRGLIYANAHVRGGGEIGKGWYDNGKLLSKKNTFSDFITCAEYLEDNNITSPNLLCIEGGSAGGLLIGAVINKRPELFRAVLADVPFVDVLNTMLDPTLSAVVSEYEEWGDPNQKRYFDYIRSYCPYQNVKRQNYPAMLVLAGFHDTRVNYWESLKWVAKLRELKTDNNLLLLKVDLTSGHMGASGRYDFYRSLAFENAFILDQLGE